MISDEYGTGWSPPDDSPNLLAELALAKKRITLLEAQLTGACELMDIAIINKAALITLVDRALTDYNLRGEIRPTTLGALAIAVDMHQHE